MPLQLAWMSTNVGSHTCSHKHRLTMPDAQCPMQSAHSRALLVSHCRCWSPQCTETDPAHLARQRILCHATQDVHTCRRFNKCDRSAWPTFDRDHASDLAIIGKDKLLDSFKAFLHKGLHVTRLLCLSQNLQQLIIGQEEEPAGCSLSSTTLSCA